MLGMIVYVENFEGIPDQVRESVLAKVEHCGPGIRSWRAAESGIWIELVEGADAKGIADRITALVDETIRSFRFFKDETLVEEAGEPTHHASPFPLLIDTGQVSFIAPGAPVYQGRFARRLSVADDRFRELAWARGAMEQLYPTTVPTESLTRNGYLASYPQHALLVASIHRDADSLAQAADMAKAGGDFANSVRPFAGACDEVLAPTVCYRCFESLRSSPSLARPLGAGRTFTGIAYCHRREDKALVELSRLQSFRMREVVFIGTPEFVSGQRQWWISEFTRLLRDWRVRFRIVSASDPFFLSSSAQKRAYQSVRRLKYECQLHLPHSDQWVAVASFNNHEATLVSAYDLDQASGAQSLHSGCIGVGYDRLVYGLLCQFGDDSRMWPESLPTFFREDRAGQAAPWSD
jgi:hypothetical protein